MFADTLGVCSLPISECEVWQLPSVDGWCRAVGPRACPNAWDPDAEVSCQPGDSVPCREGFVLAEGDAACIPRFRDDCGADEIPVLGGDCKRIGPPPGTGGGPLFDDCGEGLLSVPSGGCVLVGPRGCPKSWDPGSDVSCEPGEVLPCPEDWVEDDGGLHCEPIYDDCGPGERPVLGGGCERVVPLLEDCPAGDFPPPPEGANDLLYVAADSACAAGCGSEDAPFPTVQTALDNAPPGAHVLLGPGIYNGFRIEQAVHLIGHCASTVEIDGAVEDASVTACITIEEAEEVSIEGLSVTCPAIGLRVLDTVSVSIDAVAIEGSCHAGIIVEGPSVVEATALWVHSPGFGCSVSAVAGGRALASGSLTVSGSLVEGAFSPGLEAVGPGTELAALQTFVGDGPSVDGGDKGPGISVSGGGRLTVTDSLVMGTPGQGIRVSGGGTEATLERVLVNGIPEGSSPDEAAGVLVEAGGALSARSLVVQACSGAGFILRDSGTNGLLVSSSALNMVAGDATAPAGQGARLLAGASLDAASCLFEENQTMAVYGEGSGSMVRLQGTVVRATKPSVDGANGGAVWIQEGATLDAIRCLFEQNQETGIILMDPGTQATLEECAIRDTQQAPSGYYGEGLWVQEEASLELSDSLVDGSAETGILVLGNGTHALVMSSVIRDTRESAGGSGVACGVADGGRLELLDSLLEESRGIGIIGTGAETEIISSGSIIRDTAPLETGEYGIGAWTDYGATLSMSECLLEGSHWAGVYGWKEPTEIHLDGIVVRDTGADKWGEATSVYADEGSLITARDSLLMLGRDIDLVTGVYAQGPGAIAELDAVLVRANDVSLGWEFGIAAEGGGRIVAVDSAVEWCTFAGVTGTGASSSIDLDRVVIRDTGPEAVGGVFTPEQRSPGIMMVDGCALSVRGCMITRSTNVGVYLYQSLDALGAALPLEMSDTIIRDTQPFEGDAMGAGMLLSTHVDAELSRVLFQESSTAGLWADGSRVDVRLSESAVLHTRHGGTQISMPGGGTGFQEFGDGVVVNLGASMKVESSVVAYGKRAGIFFNESSGDLVGNQVGGNASYGLVMQDCAGSVIFEEGGNLFGGNAYTLQAGQAAQVTDSPGEIAVGEAPKIEVPR